MKLIDKDALVAEIERLHKVHCSKYGCDEVALNLEHLEDFLDTLEVKELQEEPVSKELEKIVEEIAEPTILNAYGTKELARRLRNTICGTSVSEDLEEAADNCYYHNHAYAKESFIEGAQWQKANLWKPADGADLPEYEREVIALEGIVDPTATDCLCGYKVIFAHRPATEGYDGKSITTGETEHYTPKTYGEGGWNIPNIVCWLDVELPKEIEL